ncbi:hypothetical protein F7725_008025 [Dissostichus mawsoni]|uniref:Large ribosomal subunit protein bL35m n=1 Tax=Dissostichus mawsoni TaxID=36200 RepID=A0A7J5Y602_DISMA|nr:hypothetical protein F7725_008025 [Dissostichus mawsoni]
MTFVLTGLRTYANIPVEKMAAAFARRVSGLLRPLSVSLCARTTLLCPLSSLIQPAPLYGSAAAAVRAPLRAAVCLTPRCSILQRVSALIPSLTQQPSRSLTYVSLKKGKRKSVKSVTERFMRLHCDLWIRRKAGYKKKQWKKSPTRRNRLREHVFCNKSQTKLLDRMTTSFWKRRNWFVNDPYLKYHDRVNLKALIERCATKYCLPLVFSVTKAAGFFRTVSHGFIVRRKHSWIFLSCGELDATGSPFPTSSVSSGAGEGGGEGVEGGEDWGVREGVMRVDLDSEGEMVWDSDSLDSHWPNPNISYSVICPTCCASWTWFEFVLLLQAAKCQGRFYWCQTHKKTDLAY